MDPRNAYAQHSGLFRPQSRTTVDDLAGLAVDASGNVYIADSGSGTVEEWNATTRTLSTLVFLGLVRPVGVAVDGSGNVYITDSIDSSGGYAIKEWNAATQTLGTLISSGLAYPAGVAVDGSGDLFIAEPIDPIYGWGVIDELPRAFVPPARSVWARRRRPRCRPCCRSRNR